MLPSLVTDEVRNGLLRSLLTQFQPSNDAFKRAIERMIENPSWMKGPYIQLGLPFVPGTEGVCFFEQFATEFPGHRHQETAWQRIARQGRSTLVATGTGSGKTECFMYPVLDHAARARQQGRKGIKAIIIYPMNALADDQARRFAEIIDKTPAFAGLRIGLFVGTGKSSFRRGKPGQNPQQEPAEMGPANVIMDKDRLRAEPPDILLTNYKMLDFLMIRPKDQPLWRFNEQDTLRHLIVDELHTFDGAQGTDLALLIRRLRHRLDVPVEQLVCVGTSATLGDAAHTQPLRDYAAQVFGTVFDEGSVVTESRQSSEVFLGGKVAEIHLADPLAVRRAVQVESFSSQEEAIRCWIPAFFAETTTLDALIDGVSTTAGRVKLGEELLCHVLFQKLLRVLNGNALSVDDIITGLGRAIPGSLQPLSREVLRAFLGLISWARALHPNQTLETPVSRLRPFVSVRVQLWVRELNRMVATVSDDPEQIYLYPDSAEELPRQEISLPVIQCSKCQTTGWLTRKHKARGKVETRLDPIYQAFFATFRSPELLRLYPVDRAMYRRISDLPLLPMKLCRSCGELQGEQRTECVGCNSGSLTGVLVASATREKKLERQDVVVHDDACPVCDARDSMVVLGARATTMAATSIERMWSTPVNDDKKLIVFSDSVQDAAHRAGYFEAKTDDHLTRAALAKILGGLVDGTPWRTAVEILYGQITTSPDFARTPEEMVSRFIPPDMQTDRDWVRLKEDHQLPVGSRLPDRIGRRMQWRAVEELTHLSERGTTLQKIGLTMLFPDIDRLRAASQALTESMREEFGGFERIGEEAVRHWLIGFCLHLIRTGAVFHFDLERFAGNGNFDAFRYTAGRGQWITFRGKAPTPRFVCDGSGPREFHSIAEADQNPLTTWFKLCFEEIALMQTGLSTEAYRLLMRTLEAYQLGQIIGSETNDRTGRVFGLREDALRLHNQLVRLKGESSGTAMWAPECAAELLLGMCSSTGRDRFIRAEPPNDWWRERYQIGDVHRVIAHEHTGLLDRDERVGVQQRFMASQPSPWFENLLSATPTLEMGVDIGSLSSVMLCGVPGNQASYLQRVGRAGRRDGNASVFTVAESRAGGHDLYYFANPVEMIAGPVEPPAIFLGAAEVLRRQLYAFFFDNWVRSAGTDYPEIPDKLGQVLDIVDSPQAAQRQRFPYPYIDYILQNGSPIFEAFCCMLGEHLRADTRAKLEGYLNATEHSQGLAVRFLSFFEEGVALRKDLKRRADVLRKSIQALQGKPQDEQRDHEIAQRRSEREGIVEQIAQLNGEHLLEAITNAGLLPNYAFPEEGVSLHTILRKTRVVNGNEEAKQVEVHRYTRPAASALSEFAPRNTFYAHKSRVKIDQVETAGRGSVGIVDHRLCANCHHLEPVATSTEAHTCPRCGDGRWSAVDQRRPLLRLTRAVANIDQLNSTRIREDDDKRRPEFYGRILLMNNDPADVRYSWTFRSEGSVFGFEFLRAAKFHDLNTGPGYAEAGIPTIIIGGNDGAKPGFSLCRSCGIVQPEFDPARPDERKQAHLSDCRNSRAENTTEHLSDGLFLFREFDSECLRILVPHGLGSDEQTIQSFMAAIQLGMRKRFGGQIDHLRFDTCRISEAAGHSPNAYVLIYDSVPGGTGYLEKLLSDQADSLSEVFRLALETMQACTCTDIAGLDGCYRCILQHRHARDRTVILKSRAIEVLDHLVNGNFTKTAGERLNTIFHDPELGSELERNFLFALRALGGKQDLRTNQRLPSVSLVHDIFQGHVAYLLTIGEQRYWMQKQISIELPGSNVTLCQPDFLIRPARSMQAMKPIAIFIDGWKYHWNITADDAVKRSSLVASGLYHVWSVAHGDIARAMEGESSTDLDGMGSLLEGTFVPPLPATMPTPREGTYIRNAVAELISLLGDKAFEDPLVALRDTARGLAIRVLAKKQTGELMADAEQFFAAMPEWSHITGNGAAISSPSSKGVQLIGLAARKLVVPDNTDGISMSAGLVLRTGPDPNDEEGRKTSWRQWLRAYNVLQVVPYVVLVTPEQLRSGDVLKVPAPRSSVAGEMDSAWTEVIEDVVARVKPVFSDLALAGAEAPSEIGCEIDDMHGYRLAEAIWEPMGVVFLTTSQFEYATAWISAGLKVVHEAADAAAQLKHYLITQS